MSSDESDVNKNTDMNLYHIKSLPWRRNLDIVMGMIDKQRLKDKDLYSALGAKPGLRVRGVRNIESTRDIPPGIPEVLIKLLKLDYVICHMVSRLTNLVMSWSQG